MVTSEICDPKFFLNKERIKLMYREVTLMVIFLCGFFYMLHAVFNSEINLRDKLSLKSKHVFFSELV